MSTYQLIAASHGLIGAVALLTFWTAAFARKGSPLHKSAGKIFLTAIAAVIFTGIPLAAARFVQHNIAGGMFLTFLLVLTATSSWTSWRAIRDKSNWRKFIGPIYQILMWLNLVMGIAVIVVAMQSGTGMLGVMLGFASIGVILFVQMFRFQRQPPADAKWWLKQHLGSMLGNGIATHIAFLSIGLPRMIPQLTGASFQPVAWFAPVVIAGFAGIYLSRKYVSR